MWRVLLPVLLAVTVSGPVPVERELLYVRGGWIYGLESGALWEGTMPSRCADGSVVYVREGDLWRDGESLGATEQWEFYPSCVEDIVYSSGGHIWRFDGEEHERLWEGSMPALSPDGRIAYRGVFQGMAAIYVRDGDETVLTYPGRGDYPVWYDGRLYMSGDPRIGYWDGTMHWLDIYFAFDPCPTPDGLYYVVTEPVGTSHRNIYRDGELVVEGAYQPAW
jgi:hypothetical protein